MATILDFHKHSGPALLAVEPNKRPVPQIQSRQPQDDEQSDCWPEVSSGMWIATGNNEPRKENSAGRVLSEVGLILGITALLVTLTAVMLGTPPG